MKLLAALLIACTLCSARAEGNLSQNSTPSELSAFASVIVVAGSVEALGSAGTAVVESVETAGDVITVVFKSASNASRATVKGSSTVLGRVSLVAGTTVSVATLASGYAIVAAGQVIAFFPNEAGRALMHQSRYQPQGR